MCGLEVPAELWVGERVEALCYESTWLAVVGLFHSVEQGKRFEDWGSGYSFALGNVVLGRECFP